MSTYRKGSHFRDFYIREIIGSSIVADISVSLDGIWNRTELENIIDKREHPSYTGTYRHMYNGRLPYNKKCKEIHDKLKKNENSKNTLAIWKNHPFWRLLYILKPTFDEINNALLCVDKKLHTYLWDNPTGNIEWDFIFQRKHLTSEDIESIAQYENFDALIMLTALSREAHIRNDESIHYHCVLQTRKIFARVICNTPQLYIRWPVLLQFYIEPIWFLESGKHYKILDISGLEEEIREEEKLAISKGVLLPPKNEFRNINKKEWFLVDDAFKH